MVYGDAQTTGKNAYLVELSRLYQDNSSMPMMIGGDFKVMRNNTEKNKPTGNDHWSFVFNAIIEQAGLRELPLGGRKYTWANNQSDPTYEKLDRVLICPDWEEHYPLTTVQALERELSDHTPLIVDSREKKQ